MDPITLVGLLAAVAQLIDITSKVVNYFNDVKNAPKDRAKLAREAAGLHLLFTDLRCRMEETPSTDPWFAGLKSLGGEGGPLMEFQSAMKDIADKLAPETSPMNLKRVVRWTLDKKEIDAILSKIERLKTLVGLALQKDHFKLSLAIKEEITVGFQEIKIHRDADKINQWLAAPHPSSNHNDAMRKRQLETGRWFTQSKDFVDWKIGTSSFIWLHGIPGCGKTILCSTIIQDVIFCYQSESTVAVVYFYFDFNDLDKQSTQNLIRSLIAQLSAKCPDLPESLQSAYSQSQNGHNQPTVEDMTILLRQMLRVFKGTYILLDALDECTDREDLLELMKVLISWNVNDLHVLATSRKENDIATSLDPLVRCQLSLQNTHVNDDIQVHVLDRLSNDPKLNKWPNDVQREIEDTLTKGANGMFRWVACQLDSLRKCLKLDALRKALRTLPKTLDDTYERILANLDQDYQEDALKIFQWLCFSARAMQLEELVEVLATDSNPDFRFRLEQRLPDPLDILTICSSLVNVTPATTNVTSTLRLAHFSVKEYLISDRLKEAPMQRYHITPLSANLSMAKICLTYLLHFESPTVVTPQVVREFPLINYAARFWPRHYRAVTDNTMREELDILGLDLVESKKSCFTNWLRALDHDRPRGFFRFSLFRSTGSPLYHMSCLGIIGVVKTLLNSGADVNKKAGVYGTVLSAASYNGHLEMVLLLLKNGANINAKGGLFGSALSAASIKGNEEMVRLLLEQGANLDVTARICLNALSAASHKGHKDIVRLLLETGANVNAESEDHGSALSEASRGGHEDIVHLLLDKGANVNAQSGRALREASRRGHTAIMRLLLKYNANANLIYDHYDKGLEAISVDDHDAVIQLLLKRPKVSR